MDARSILDMLLASGKQMTAQVTEKATDFAEKNLGLPEAGPKRDEMLGTLGKGAAIGGIVTMLLGTKSGRKISGGLLKVGSVAAVGAVAYTAYQNWMKSQGKSTSEHIDAPIATLTGVAADKRSLTLLRAMIAAAASDGHIDEQEKTAITDQLQRMDLADDAQDWLRTELQSPQSAASIAAMADSPAAAAEIYVASSVVIDQANPDELAYLQELRIALDLDQGFVEELQAQFRKIRQI